MRKLKTERSAPGAVDTEHIFGFAEGADIGEKGERELEITATGLVGKPGKYAGIQNETALPSISAMRPPSRASAEHGSRKTRLQSRFPHRRQSLATPF